MKQYNKYIVSLYLYALNILLSLFVVLGSFYQGATQVDPSVSGWYIILAVFLWPFTCIFEVLGSLFSAICLDNKSSYKRKRLSLIFSGINLLKIGCLKWIFGSFVPWEPWALWLVSLMGIFDFLIIGFQLRAYRATKGEMKNI